MHGCMQVSGSSRTISRENSRAVTVHHAAAPSARVQQSASREFFRADLARSPAGGVLPVVLYSHFAGWEKEMR